MGMGRFENWQMPTIKHAIPTQYGWTVYYPENLTLLKNTDIGWGSFLNAHYKITIEEDVEIGPFLGSLVVFQRPLFLCMKKMFFNSA